MVGLEYEVAGMISANSGSCKVPDKGKQHCLMSR
jgi:hypothetical protein